MERYAGYVVCSRWFGETVDHLLSVYKSPAAADAGVSMLTGYVMSATADTLVGETGREHMGVCMGERGGGRERERGEGERERERERNREREKSREREKKIERETEKERESREREWEGGRERGREGEGERKRE